MEPWEKNWDYKSEKSEGFFQYLDELKKQGMDIGPAPSPDYIEIAVKISFVIFVFLIAFHVGKNLLQGNEMAKRLAVSLSVFWISLSFLYFFTDRYFGLDDLFWYGLLPIGGFWLLVWVLKAR